MRKKSELDKSSSKESMVELYQNLKNKNDYDNKKKHFEEDIKQAELLKNTWDVKIK